MKFSIMLTTADNPFAAIAMRGNIEENLRQVKQLGYEGVEFSFLHPKSVDQTRLQSVLEKYALRAVALATGRAWGEEGLSLTNPDSAIRRNTNARIKEYVNLATVFNSLVILGLIRGRIPGGSRSKIVRKWALEGIRRASDWAGPLGVRIVIEPINRYETNFLNTIEETLGFAEEVARSNVGILADTFHMNIEEASISDAFRKAGLHLLHVHVADNNRWAPGCGHLDFRAIFNTLRSIGYSDFVSVECLPKPDPVSCPRIALASLRKAAAASKRSTA